MAYDKTRFLTTGEFAALCNVKKQTLFHYDAIGLLSPEGRADNGYRYYSYNQLELFFTIRLFKELGMPLDDIKTLLYAETPAEITKALKSQLNDIDRQIDHLQHLKKIAEVKIQQTQTELLTDIHEIQLVALPSQQVVISDSVLNANERQYNRTLADFVHRLEQQQLDHGYPLGAIISRAEILAGHFENYNHFYTRVDEEVAAQTFTRPAGQYLVGYQIGDQIEAIYKKLLAEAHTQQLRVGKYMYEEYLFDRVFIDDEDKRITKVYMEIT